MKRYLAALAVAVAAASTVPADAATVTLTGATGPSCTYTAGSTDSAGNVTFACLGGVILPYPIPDPVYPPLANANTSAVHSGVAGQSYTYQLPRFAVTGAYSSGFLQQGDRPGTPSGLTIEWAISRVPGDFGYYRSAAAAVVSARGGTVYPCGGTNGSVGASYYWSLTGSAYECKVDQTQTWYINVRYVAGCPAGASCEVSYFHSEN